MVPTPAVQPLVHQATETETSLETETPQASETEASRASEAQTRHPELNDPTLDKSAAEGLMRQPKLVEVPQKILERLT